MAAGRSSTGISPRPMLMGAPRNALRAFNAGVSLSCLRVLAHKLLNLFYGAVVLARLFPYGEKLSWRTRRLARYRRNVPVCLLCCAPKAAFFVKEQ